MGRFLVKEFLLPSKQQDTRGKFGVLAPKLCIWKLKLHLLFDFNQAVIL